MQGWCYEMARAKRTESGTEPPRRLIVLTGVSGAGKTLALQTLEDLGYFCIDNLPPSLLEVVGNRDSALTPPAPISPHPPQPSLSHEEREGANSPLPVGEGQGVRAETPLSHSVGKGQGVRANPIVAVVDTRSREPLEHAEQTILQMRQSGVPVEVLFLDCSDEVLLRRFKETRRPHPLASVEPDLRQAIARERNLLAPLRAIADRVLDTSLFRAGDLREAIRQLYGETTAKPSMRVRVVSFGFKYGVPSDADLVFDVRFLRNPHYVPELQPRPGTDPEVCAYVLNDAESTSFVQQLQGFLSYLLPRYVQEGKAYLTIAIGCTGGRHRSVVLGNLFGEWLSQQGYRTTVEHRDIERGGV